MWLYRQGLTYPRTARKLTREAFTAFLEQVGGLQVDSISVVERAHYLTLWSRFGPFGRDQVDEWVYRERVAYEYWGHQASILPISHLPLGMRRMRRFPPVSWKEASWWPLYAVPPAVKRRVLSRLRVEGPLQSADFKRRREDGSVGGALPLPHEEKRALQLLWHSGKVAVHDRHHFRRLYDLAERIYPADVTPATTRALEDSWLLVGLAGNGIASERHLVNYWTSPGLAAAARQRVIARHIKSRRIVKVRLLGLQDPFYGLPEHLDGLSDVPVPRGTTLICPFDSLLWQRQRAEELLGFRYRLEIYTPPRKRVFGYYVLPILHDGRLVGRIDPKYHRSRGVLEIKSVYLDHPDLEHDADFKAGLREAIAELGLFLQASSLQVPSGRARWLE